MYKNDRWGVVSFDLVCPEEETVHLSDTDSNEKNLAMLNYVEASLIMEKNKNSYDLDKTGNRVYGWGILTGLTLTTVALLGCEFGLNSLPCWAGSISAGLLAFCTLASSHYRSLLAQANSEIDVELSKARNLRSAIQQSK